MERYGRFILAQNFIVLKSEAARKDLVSTHEDQGQRVTQIPARRSLD